MVKLVGVGVTPCSEIFKWEMNYLVLLKEEGSYTPFQNHGEIKTTVQVIWFRHLISFWFPHLKCLSPRRLHPGAADKGLVTN